MPAGPIRPRVTPVSVARNHGAGARSERPHLADLPAASLHPDEPRHRPDPDRIAFRPDTRRLLEVLARNRLLWTWLDLEASPKAERILQGLDVPVADLPLIVVPGGPVLRNPGGRALLDALAIFGDAGGTVLMLGVLLGSGDQIASLSQ
jgi:hypothetical protein